MKHNPSLLQIMRFFPLILGWMFGWMFSPFVAAFPEQFSATYTVSVGDTIMGEANWSLKPTGGGHYRYDAVTFPTGFISLFYKSRRTEHSEWHYQGDRIRPLLYRYNRGGKKDRKVKVVFDWDQGIVWNTAKGKTWEMPIPPGTLDKNVCVLALMQDLARGLRDFEYPIADGGRIKTYRFSFVGEEVFDTALGRLQTLRIKRIRENATRETTYWCAPKFDYLPVKVVHREKDGKIITMRISEFFG
uniref:DUF3108 domain-containing protein n=1 Tax=Candidatus Kentrum sp. FM TaxID=2126340 RepID=A0A450U2K7_9GAMM|nr:MAG: Protein of unknown function (DUF3108) [Candidatus Kentron sp. FM]VFJ77319.1 MAG: Protein of unknown function (DUF3108) [Candidatus Kentron sp. FM]VFK17913.1 MAG: Protein of unknown function (DUF3108) [Candidatus Kentron sp. FM]